MKQLTRLSAWKNLESHAQEMRFTSIDGLKGNAQRNAGLTLSTGYLHIDFTNQRVNQQTVKLLLSLAHERNLAQKITDLMEGGIVNFSAQSPALHTALRADESKAICVDGIDVMRAVLATREKMASIAQAIRDQKWLGYSDEPITDIVNIGIGGSDLGPRFCIKAFAEISASHLGYHFISDVDPNAFSNTVAKLKPQTTLFIVSSKSFMTEETRYNAEKALAWIGDGVHQHRHFIAITANAQKAHDFGFRTVLPIWNWVGGRYSSCSAINLITMIAIGYDAFMDFLAGARHMDTHFQHTDFAQNLPVLLGLFGIWNINFLHIHNLLMLTYAQQLEYLVPYIQQLDMESNGKSINNEKQAVNHATGPMIWGGLGNQAQHSYYQLLCQGTHRLSVDFITNRAFGDEVINEICALKRKILAEGLNDLHNPEGYIPGNIPLNNISISCCTPFSIGELIALYEHKVYVQSVIWDINPFDQPAVESAKRKNIPHIYTKKIVTPSK